MSSSLTETGTHKTQSSLELLSKTEQLLYFRLAFAAVGAVLCMILWWFGHGLFDLSALGSSCGLVLGYTSSTLALALTKVISTKKQLTTANAILIVLDVLTLTLIVHLTFGVESDLYVLYLLPILLSSYTFGKKGTYLTALLVSVSYVGLLIVENVNSLVYLIPNADVTMANAYASKFWTRIFGRSVLLVSVSFIWARFVSYMSGLAHHGENRLREQLEDNNRMVAEIQAQAQREALINSINAALRSTLELDRILVTAADELAGALNVYRCAIVCKLAEVDDEIFVCEADPNADMGRAGQSSLKYFDAEICEFILNTRSRYENIEEGLVMKTFVYSDPHEEPIFEPIREKLTELNWGSLIVQPMMYRDLSKGVIIIAEIDPRRYWSANDLELVKSVGGQVAVAIEQASLIEELSKTNQNLVEKNTNLDAKNSELRQMQSQLIHQEKMASLGRLVAGIAHELNNPINFVHGNLPYLKEYVDDMRKLVDSLDGVSDEAKGRLAELKDEVRYDFLTTDLDNIIADLNEGTDRIRLIIRDLKSFSRLDEAELKEASIQEGIESTAKILSQYFGRDKTPLIKNFGEVPNILCYAGQLNQVWMNLMSNAAQAVQDKDDGKVEVTTRVENGQVLVSISDNGPGIKPEIQSKIFDPFFTTKPVGQGTGLGLSICHSIVGRHGGRIELSTKLNEGTTFTVMLPLKAEQLEQEVEEAERS
jgi:signal transduction histidine kinase